MRDESKAASIGDEQIAERLRAATGRFVRSVGFRDVLPAAQAAALGHLGREGAMSIAALAVLEQVRHQSAARTVAHLEEQQLVEVVPDMRDRRRVIVLLTESGKEQLAADRESRTTRIAAAIAALPDSDRALLARIPMILDRLGAAVTGASVPVS